MNYIDQDVAARFIRKQIDIILGGEEEIKQVILSALDDILALGYPMGLSAHTFKLDNHPQREKVRQILNAMRLAIYSIIATRCEQAVEQREECNGMGVIISVDDVLNDTSYGDSIRKRASLYANRLTQELEMWMAIGLLNNLSASEVSRQFDKNANRPYSNEKYSLTRKDIAKGALATAAIRLLRSPSFVKGNYTSAVNALDRLLRIAVASAARIADYQAYKKAGIIGFYVYRGSSYPCSHCDSMVGFHPFTMANLPPYHPYCYCYAVPVQ